MDEKTLEKINGIASKLEAHLQVAEFVDKNSGKDIKRLFGRFDELFKKVNALETDMIILKNSIYTKKEYFVSLAKLITLICAIIGTIFAFIKIGITN